MRVGVVDLGTNSTRLLVADVDRGALVEIERRLAITRLGAGVDEERRLEAEAVERVRRTLGGYRSVLDGHGVARAVAVATSAVRDSANGPDFLAAIRRDFGLEPRLLTGEEEALLTFRGVASGRRIEEETLVVDVGGGSTELVVGGRGGVSFHASLDLGCVRETERFLGGDPPSAAELGACGDHVRATLASKIPADVRPPRAIGVAGTVTTLATLDLGLDAEDPELVHGHVLETGWVAAQLDSLGAATIAELRARRGIHHDRAPVIVAGAVVLLETLRSFGIGELEVSERDVMHGAALEAAEAME
jgi:exopolyphosphatase/guanosine-5'-triphosphate,3'-diphosphate pyrophosphatase